MNDDRSYLEGMLLEVHSRERTDEVAAWIGGDADRFAAAWDVFCNGTPPFPQRMAWVMDIVTQEHPSHAARYVASVAARLRYFQHPAELRAATKILARTPLPIESIGDLLLILFPWLENPLVPAAIRCNAMDILYKISQVEPDLKRELALVIETQMRDGGPAIISRGKKLLGRLMPELKAMDAVNPE